MGALASAGEGFAGRREGETSQPQPSAPSPRFGRRRNTPPPTFAVIRVSVPRSQRAISPIARRVTYILPEVDRALRHGPGSGIRATVINRMDETASGA
jgi:hypothetical protein